ncbi:MAG: UbiH/UbiF/VisC/COQ6 family ubiquinone biosynthesis hydroxylase [Hyphomonadaceae bacterium]|nr:MAG: UbiH/UbiF/VisC/COQ6 family ubiquinone biosynthesis hydroxylase [Hyphomonadaceae bacterium]KAF0186104.1 MAG: UbiH/UbiF/VisC/COQ6 family ubiquinone biosynthesis hydroxylase [Hyphomonadaceae bacterium]
MTYDFVVCGAGPAGLTFAALACLNGFKTAIIEKQTEEAIADPQYDGRDIALTHKSKEILSELGIWEKFNPATISTIDKAIVNNGENQGKMALSSSHAPNLAYVVSNHLIRQHAYDLARSLADISLFFDNEIIDVERTNNKVKVALKSGESIEASLLIAADSRFSTLRKRLGVSASMLDFGKTMVVCRMKHEFGHNNVANECFGNGYTLALLPLVGPVSSAVITMKPWQIDELLAKSDADFNAWVKGKLGNRFGKMEVIGEKFAYPLVGVYANRFFAPRFAAIGDAAVGMHPVTAHGFNFGLLSIKTLMDSILLAKKHGIDMGSANVLAQYDRKHRNDTLPLYLMTAGIVGLYTNETIQARIARRALIEIADKMAPIKALMMNKLVDDGNSHFSNKLPSLPKLPFLRSHNFTN